MSNFVSVQIVGLDKLIRGMSSGPLVVKKEQSKLIEEVSRLIEARSKGGVYPPAAPVDTGELRMSITNRITPNLATITAGAHHAIYVHQGTRFMKPRPFFPQSIKASKNEIERAAQRTGDKIAIRLTGKR